MIENMNQTLDRLSDQLFTRESAWTAVGFLAAAAGAVVARKLIESGWRTTTGQEPPKDPASEEDTWVQTMTWAVATGALVGVVRVLSRRGARSAWRRWI